MLSEVGSTDMDDTKTGTELVMIGVLSSLVRAAWEVSVQDVDNEAPKGAVPLPVMVERRVMTVNRVVVPVGSESPGLEDLNRVEKVVHVLSDGSCDGHMVITVGPALGAVPVRPSVLDAAAEPCGSEVQEVVEGQTVTTTGDGCPPLVLGPSVIMIGVPV